MCVTQHVHCTVSEILLTTEEQGRPKENCAPRVHTAPTAQLREGPRTKCAGLATPTNRFPQALATGLITDKLSILRGSRNIPLVYEFTHAHA